MPLFACLYRPRAREASTGASATLREIAEAFSPRYESVHDDCTVIDVAGLRQMFGEPRQLGETLRRQTTARGLDAHVAIARTRTAAQLLAVAHEGLLVVADHYERQAVAPLAIGVLDTLFTAVEGHDSLVPTFTAWGLRRLGDLAALPTGALRARIGSCGVAWQTAARGEDTRPLIPTSPDERFESTCDLEWPIDSLEPLSFVLTRLLEPLVAQLEQRDRSAAAIHLTLRLVTKDSVWRHLDLPAPMRDVRTLRTLIGLHVEANPPGAAIDRVTILLDPTPARVVQHSLLSRAQPAPERVATLIARLTATMGADRVGSPVVIDSDRPGAFAMRPFRTGWDTAPTAPTLLPASETRLISAFRCYRPPVPARVVTDPGGVPTHVIVDRAGFACGQIDACAGPWTTSGEWWGAKPWDREEWDARVSGRVIYRLAHHVPVRQWFIHAVAD